MTDLNMDRLGKLRQDLQEKFKYTNNRVRINCLQPLIRLQSDEVQAEYSPMAVDANWTWDWNSAV